MVEILEYLILAAFIVGKEKYQNKFSDDLSSITGGLQLPPGFKMPF